MNYKIIYDSLCQRSLLRTWKPFSYEKHHIVPKSLGGTDSKSNLAILTPREHAIAHLLLVRFLTGKDKAKMIYALKSMLSYRNKNRNQLTSRQYDSLQKRYQELCQTSEYRSWRSEITKSQWTPERKTAVAEKTRQQWVNGPKRASFGSDQYRKKKSEQMKSRWQDSEYQKQVSAWVTAQWQDPNKKPNRNLQ